METQVSPLRFEYSIADALLTSIECLGVAALQDRASLLRLNETEPPIDRLDLSNEVEVRDTRSSINLKAQVGISETEQLEKSLAEQSRPRITFQTQLSKTPSKSQLLNYHN